MNKYTIEELSMMTNLSSRTIRNYINLGILVGEKLNNKWYFSESDCMRFFNNDMVKHSIDAKALGIVLDGFNKTNNRITNILYIDSNKLDYKVINDKINSYNDFDFKLDMKDGYYRILISANINTSIDFLNFVKEFI